jgi:hypothetical protein
MASNDRYPNADNGSREGPPGRSDRNLRGLQWRLSAMAKFTIAAAILAAPIAVANEQPQAAEALSKDVQIVPLDNAINYVDLTGHGPHDVVVRAFWDLGFTTTSFHDTFLWDTSFESDNVFMNTPKQLQTIGIEATDHSSLIDHADEFYRESCPDRTIILYKRSGPRTQHDNEALSLISKNKEVMDRYINTFFLSLSVDNTTDGNAIINIEKFQLYDNKGNWSFDVPAAIG